MGDGAFEEIYGRQIRVIAGAMYTHYIVCDKASGRLKEYIWNNTRMNGVGPHLINVFVQLRRLIKWGATANNLNSLMELQDG